MEVSLVSCGLILCAIYLGLHPLIFKHDVYKFHSSRDIATKCHQFHSTFCLHPTLGLTASDDQVNLLDRLFSPVHVLSFLFLIASVSINCIALSDSLKDWTKDSHHLTHISTYTGFAEALFFCAAIIRISALSIAGDIAGSVGTIKSLASFSSMQLMNGLSTLRMTASYHYVSARARRVNQVWADRRSFKMIESVKLSVEIFSIHVLFPLIGILSFVEKVSRIDIGRGTLHTGDLTQSQWLSIFMLANQVVGISHIDEVQLEANRKFLFSREDGVLSGNENALMERHWQELARMIWRADGSSFQKIMVLASLGPATLQKTVICAERGEDDSTWNVDIKSRGIVKSLFSGGRAF